MNFLTGDGVASGRVKLKRTMEGFYEREGLKLKCFLRVKYISIYECSIEEFQDNLVCASLDLGSNAQS